MRATLSFDQPSGHTAGPRATVCDTAVEAWESVKDACRSFTGGEGNFHTLAPALVEFTSASDGLRQTATLRASFRLPPDVDIAEAQGRIAEAALPGSIEFDDADRAFLAPKDTTLVATFLRALRSEGLRPRFKVKTGTSDMNVVAPVWQCPTVAYGPGDSALDHTPDEHIPIHEYLRGIRVLTRVFEEWK